MTEERKDERSLKKRKREIDNCYSEKISKTMLDEYFDSCDYIQYNMYRKDLRIENNTDCLEKSEMKMKELESMKKRCDNITRIATNEEEKKAIINFRKTYDARYLKNFTNEQKDSLKEILSSEEGGNPVLLKLLTNLIENKEDIINNIVLLEGPISYYKYELDFEEQPKKIIHLFGEYHGDTRGYCETFDDNIPYPYLEFHDYIEKLSINSSYFFDIYLESPIFLKGSNYTISSGSKFFKTEIYQIIHLMKTDNLNFKEAFYKFYLNEREYETQSYIFDSMINKFKECIQPSTRMVNKNCNLMRIHNVDLRNFWGNKIDNVYNDFYLLIFEEIFSNTNLTFEEKLKIVIYLKEEMINLIEQLIKTYSIVNNTIDIYNQNLFYHKESERSDYYSEFIQQLIQEFIKESIEETFEETFVENDYKIIDYLKELKKLINDPTLPLPLGINDFFITFSRYIFIIMALFMDGYCLFRIFKKYYKEEYNSFQPKISTNIIIYAGDKHIEKYNNFFRKLSTLIYTYDDKSQYSCIVFNEEKKNQIDNDNEIYNDIPV